MCVSVGAETVWRQCGRGGRGVWGRVAWRAFYAPHCKGHTAPLGWRPRFVDEVVVSPHELGAEGFEPPLEEQVEATHGGLGHALVPDVPRPVRDDGETRKDRIGFWMFGTVNCQASTRPATIAWPSHCTMPGMPSYPKPSQPQCIVWPLPEVTRDASNPISSGRHRHMAFPAASGPVYSPMGRPSDYGLRADSLPLHDWPLPEVT